MRNLTLVVVILFLFSCVPQSNEKLYNNVQAGFEDLISDLSEDYPRNLLPQDWFEYYQDIIHQKNPNFTTNTIEGLKYLLVPYLMVNGDSIETDDIDILSLISNGTMSVDECWVMIFEDNQHIGRFAVGDRIRPLSFDDHLKNISLTDICSNDALFKIVIQGKQSKLFLPGIIILKNNDFMVLTPSGRVFPLDEMYKLLFDSKEDFEKYLHTIFLIANRK